MKIYVMTKADETVAILDNSLSGALHYFDDEFHRYLETGASTFDLSIAKKHMMYSNASTGSEDDFQYLKENHFLVFTYKNRDYKFTIRRVEETESSLRLFCEDLSFDLLNEYRGPYKADKAYHISKYVNDCLVDSGYEIGINEFTKNERTLEWEGDQTVLKRLLSICNSFEAEIEFETILNDDRTVDKQLVHLRKRVGMDRPDIELKYGRDVSSIRRSVDNTGLITAIKPRGHEEDGKITKISNVEKEVKDENGNVVFYTKKGSEYIYAPMANQEYGNPKRKGGGYIVGQFSYDTKSDTELFNRALTELQKKCVPAYEFEIEGFYDIDIGDTIRAIDEGYNPILLLEARISEQTISFSDPTKNKTVYSNYRILENKVSKSLLDRIDEVKKYAEQVAKTYIFSISNVGSPMFRNGEGEVIFTAKIEKNNQDFTDEFNEFNWIKQKKDGTQDEDWNAAHQGIGKSITVKPEDFEDTATFSYEALQDDLSIGGASGVVTKVYDGEDGKTPIKGVDYFDGQDGTNGLSAYLHIRYSQNSNGNPMTENPVNAKYIGVQASQNPNPSTVPADYMWAEFKGQDGIPGETGADGKTSYLHIKYSNDGGQTFTGNGGEDAGSWMGQYVDFMQVDSTDVKKYAWSKIKGEDGQDGVAGKDGVGLKATVIQYAQSTSGITAPTSGWTTQVPTLIKGQYLWTKTVWTYTDETNETGYTVSYNAKDGSNGTDGIAGKDGVGISNTVIEYVGAVSGTSKPTSGWSTTIPTVPQGQYLWTRTTWTYTDGTKEQGYSAALMGPKGDKGDTGDDGQTPVVHQAWSWSADGTDRFTTVYPNENLWLGEREYYWESATAGWSEYTGIRPTDNGTKFTDATFVTASFWIKTTEKLSTEVRAQVIFSKNGVRQYVYNIYVPRADAISGEMVKRTIDITEYSTEINEVSISVLKPIKIVGEEFRISDIKIELGENLDPIYTPSPSEDYANAYPLYEGTYTDYSETASHNPADYTWRRIIGESGQDGVAGADGKGIKSTVVTYQASTSGTVAPTGTWVANPPTVAKGSFLWTRTIWTYTDDTTETGYSVAYVAKDGNDGEDGIAGKDGIGIKSTKVEYAASASGTTKPTSGWATTIPSVPNGQFLWTRTTWTYDDNTTEQGFSVAKMGETGPQGPSGKDGAAGKDGVGIKSTTVTYALSDSGTTAPTSGWTPTVPTLTKGKYLWTKSVWTYTDNSTETGYSVTYVAKDGNNGSDGLPGKDGVGIKSTAITYAVSSSGTTAPSSGWVASPPTAAAGQFLWTKTVWTYTDNSTETGYSVGKMGANGSDGQDGVGVASTAITYQASTSGTTAPSDTWSTTIPNVPAGQFLWTKTVTTYTNNTNSTAYTVAKMGSDGKPGSAGVSVSSVVEEYYVSTSPTSQAGGSWSTTVPNNADPNKYIWRRLKTTMSNGTVTYTNPALIQGMTGIYPYIGPTQPANPKENQQWWKSDASGNVTNFYVYKSGSWQEQTIQQSVLNIIELNAVRILGSTITGTTINTSILNNSGTYQDSGATIIYNSTYNGNITADWAVENSTQNGTFILSPRNLAAISYTDAARKNPGWHWVIDNNGIDVGNPSYSAIYGGEGITIYNAQLSPTYGRVKLEFQDLMTMPATLIPASSGFSQYATSGDNAPLVSRQGRVVQLSGAFKNNAVLESGASGTMGILPVWARPERAVLMRVQASYNNTYLLTVNTNGTITMSRHAAGENNVSVPAGSWLNIAIVYAAADI